MRLLAQMPPRLVDINDPRHEDENMLISSSGFAGLLTCMDGLGKFLPDGTLLEVMRCLTLKRFLLSFQAWGTDSQMRAT